MHRLTHWGILKKRSAKGGVAVGCAKHLPTGYAPVHHLDFVGNRRLAWGITWANWGLIALLELPVLLGWRSMAFARFTLVGVLLAVGALLLLFVLHELIHGLCFYSFSRQKITRSE